MDLIGSLQHLDPLLLAAVLCGLLAIEECGVPLPFAPGDMLLLLGSVILGSRSADPLLFGISATLAMTAGAMVGREIAAAVGRASGSIQVMRTPRFHRLLDRLSNLVLRGGSRAVFIARLIPGLRICTTQIAGLSRLPRLTFAIGLVPAVLIYVSVFVGMGAVLGSPAIAFLHELEHQTVRVAPVLLVLLIVVLGTVGCRAILGTARPLRRASSA